MAQRQAAAAAKVPLGMAGTLFFGSLCVGTGALGIWQTQRFFEKQRLIQQRSTELKLEPLPYPHTFQQPHQQQEPQPNNHHHINHKINNEHSFRRWRLTGHYRHEDEFLVGPRGPPSGAQQEGSALPPPPQGLSSSPQGYYVVTPFQLAVTTTAVDETKNPCHTAATSSSPTATAPSMWVLVNRGWIPRHMVQSQQPQPQHRQQQQQQQRGSTEASPATPPALLEWNRPKGTVQVTVVPAKPEEPKFLVAQHNLASVPAILYWYDLPTMQAVAGLPATNGTDIPQQLDFVTQVHDDDKDGYNEDMRASSSTAARAAASWPVQPHATKVGDFKVSPAVHAGYAVTWYGLCAAGLYMTRILLTRGRG